MRTLESYCRALGRDDPRSGDDSEPSPDWRAVERRKRTFKQRTNTMKKPKIQQARQGDVFIERIAEANITEPAKKEDGRTILAHGEVTGHAHAIAAPKVVKSKERTEQRQNAPAIVSELEIQQALAELRHEEHGTIPLEEGAYRVTRQREYSPEAIRNVAD